MRKHLSVWVGGPYRPFFDIVLCIKYHNHAEFLQWTTLQNRVWTAVNRYISSEDQCQTRLLTISFSLSPGYWLIYKDQSSREAWNTINILDVTSATGLALLSHTRQVKTTSVAGASAVVGLNSHKGKSKILKFNQIT